MLLGLRYLFFFCLWVSYAGAQSLSSVSISTHIYKDSLALDFYTRTEDVSSDRMLILVAHGGGFAGGTRDNPLEKEFCEFMAQKGYAVVSISYRLTRKGESTGFGCDCPASDKVKTFVAATEDISAATQFCQEHARDWNFDPGKVVLMGSSAGAEGVLNTAFMGGHHAFKHIDLPQVAGVISLAGAVMDVRYLTPNNGVSCLLFHGHNDKLVPYGTAAHHYCSTASEGYIQLDGSKTIADRLHQLELSYMLVHDTEGNHDWAGLGYAETGLIIQFLENYIDNPQIRQTCIQLNTR